MSTTWKSQPTNITCALYLYMEIIKFNYLTAMRQNKGSKLTDSKTLQMLQLAPSHRHPPDNKDASLRSGLSLDKHLPVRFLLLWYSVLCTVESLRGTFFMFIEW